MAWYFECPIQCLSVAFDVLIKILESYRPQIPSIVTYKREKLSPRTISILMTLKSQGKKDEVNTNEEEFDEDTH